MRNSFALGRCLGLLFGADLCLGTAHAVKTEVSGDATCTETAADGALTLTLNKPLGGATVIFSYEDEPLDLSTWRDILFSIKNDTSAELDVTVNATSNLNDPWRQNTAGRFLVPPGKELNMTALLAREALSAEHPFVKRFGRLFSYPWGHHYHFAANDPSAILQASASLSWRNAAPGQRITLGMPRGFGEYSTNPELLDSLKFPILDPFGQANWFDWPGKIHRQQELEDDGRKDLAFASQVHGFGGQRSRFGGFLDGPKLQATGFFRVEKVDGKWWFVDPEGYLFWSLGVNSAGYGAETSVEGREELFPESMRKEKRLPLYEENLQQKYGSDDWLAKHVAVTVARMQDWGLNTFGAWSLRPLLPTQRVPYTLIIHTAHQRLGSLSKVSDPFSSSFSRSLEGGLASLAADHAKSPWLLGVFIDNEINWTGDYKLIEEVMKSPPETPARIALVEFLRKRYGKIQDLNRAWGTQFRDFSDIQSVPRPEATAAYRGDLDRFLEIFAEEYFVRCHAAMHKYFPNHLYLGCRFHMRNNIVRRVASRHCDVLSLNIYQHGVAGYSVATEVDRPWLISEFHFGMRDYGNLGTGLVWAADVQNQSDLLRAYLSDALRSANFVGAHWFAWGDQAVTGRPDGENFGVGLVTVVDRPVQTLVQAFRQVSQSMYDFRSSDTPWRIGAQPAPAPPQP